LFRGAELGTTEVTTSELVLHEVLFLMTERRHYNIDVETAIDMMEYTLQLRRFRFPVGEQGIYLRALALWRQRPSLGFANSVIAARCELNGWELATFDEPLGSLPNLTRWTPEPAG
jgi:predicted nucleic acid-binding protein